MNAERLHGLLALWTGRLGLERWDIDLTGRDAGPDGDQIDEHTMMRTVRHSAYERSVIFYATWLLEEGPERPASSVDVEMTDRRIEVVLVHELLHLYLGRIVDALDDDLDGMLHRDVHAVLSAAQARAEEWMVDTLARALVRAFADGGT